MEKETFGRKMVLFIGSILIIGGVFLFFKYLFPIIAPFVVALLIAVWIEKPVDSISRIFRGKKCLASGIIVFVITAVAVTLIIYVLWFALGEVKAFIKNYDYYIICISQSASGICKNVDMWFGFSDGSSFSALCNMVDRLQVSISDGIDTQVVGKMVSVSVPVVVSVVKIGGYVIVGIMSVIYLSGSLTDIRNWCHNCVFKQEIGVISL